MGSLEARSPPTWFLLANRLPYGRWKALDFFRKLKLLDDRIVAVPFYDRLINLPLNLVNEDLRQYQRGRISMFSSFCARHLGRFDFIDCGAHLGMFSAQFTVLSDRVQKLIAVEPNPLLFSLLHHNLQKVAATQIQCVNAALSDFEGRGRLVEAEYDRGMDAMYLVADPDGDIQVTTLAAVLRNRTQPRVAIKLDVEGQEVPVLRGAADAIRSLDRVALFVELHKDVLARTGMSDIEMLSQINAIRPFTWFNSGTGNNVDAGHGVLQELNQKQCDLIGISET